MRQIVNHVDHNMHTIYVKSQIFSLTHTHLHVSVTNRNPEGHNHKKEYNNVSLRKVIYRWNT